MKWYPLALSGFVARSKGGILEGVAGVKNIAEGVCGCAGLEKVAVRLRGVKDGALLRGEGGGDIVGTESRGDGDLSIGRNVLVISRYGRQTDEVDEADVIWWFVCRHLSLQKRNIFH